MKASPLLIETIRIQNGRVRNIRYHNQRCNQARKELFSQTSTLNLRDYIDTSLAPDQNTKCRITYNEKFVKVEYETYKLRLITSIKLLEVEDYTYEYKFADRKRLDEYFRQRGNKDDIIMTKNGFLTDTYYGNIALSKNGKWYTPSQPLLKGTMRSYLLEKKIILEKKIHKSDLNKYNSITIFNAMIPFKKIILDIENLQFEE